MRELRISASSYSNTAPLIWSFLYGKNRGEIEIILDNAPARSAELLAQKRVDAALVPVIEYQRIEGARLVPGVCVGAKKKVKSVCLVTKGEDLSDVKTVALDVSSRTSVALSKIIFREFLNFEPAWKTSRPDLKEMLGDADCALLIGDPSLTIDENIYRKFDLAETWRSFTGFGFVFAMWMAQSERIETAKTINFAAARDEGLRHIDEIISNYETDVSISREAFHAYLSENISYSIDESMKKGLELFYDLAFKHDLIEKRKEPIYLDE
ncbi:MAG: putative periplasmic solute-binding protein [Acidobacteria bacterium]|jgi:chorismate dehydratase|nr:putative periplasmic solute-binding protein [Acidobacteriota bacterium]